MTPDQELLQQEMNRGAFITIEAPDGRISSKVVTILETALKYEFKDKKFVVVNPATCTQLAQYCQNFLNSGLYGYSRLLVAATLLSETVNIITKHLNEGMNVICTGFTTDMVLEMIRYYSPEDVTGIVQLAALNLSRNSEIVLMSPVPEDEYNVAKLQSYHTYVTAAIEENASEDNRTITYRVDTTMEDIDSAVEQCIEIIGSTLARMDALKEFANKLFGDEASTEETAEEEKPIESEE